MGYTRQVIPATINTTTVKPVTDELVRSTGWVLEPDIANAVLHTSSGGVIYRYKTKHVINGSVQVHLLVGFLNGSYGPQPVLGITLVDSTSFSQHLMMYRYDNTVADVIMYSNDTLIVLGMYIKGNNTPPAPLFVYLDKTTSDVAEEETIFPIYLGTLGTFTGAYSFKKPAGSNTFVLGYAGTVVPSAAGYNISSGSPIERAAVVTSFGPVYLVKPSGLGIVPLPNLRYAYVTMSTGSFITGTATTNPSTLFLSGSNSTNAMFTFIALTA
jgi:hypothetical protein